MRKSLIFLYFFVAFCFLFTGIFLLYTNRRSPVTSPQPSIAIHRSPTAILQSPIPSRQLLTTISKVTSVIDGDTIVIEGNKKVRYIGIDAPETKHPTKGIQCFGIKASNKNKELVLGKYIRLQKDVSDTDKYGRLLRYVWIVDSPNATQSGIFVNDYLVREGYANIATFPPDVAYANQFKDAAREARNKNKGLWGECQNQ